MPTANTNITNIISPLAAQLRLAIDEWKQVSITWVEKTLALAVALKTARDTYGPNDRAFGRWLAENDCDDLGKDTRAALINMAEHLDLSTQVLQDTQSRSVRLIWDREIRPRLPAPDADIRQPSISAVEIDTDAVESPPIDAEAASSTEAEAAPVGIEVSENPIPEPEQPVTRVNNRRLQGLERADEVQAIFNQRTCATIGRAVAGRGGREIWTLILQAIDAGFVSAATAGNIVVEKLTARVLFPLSPRSWSRQYDLTFRQHRARVRNVVMPAAVACREVILANPEDIDGILRRHADGQARASREEQAQAAVAALPPGQQHIMMYGETLWPIVGPQNAGNTYDQVRCAVWTFRDLQRWHVMIAADSSVASCALRIRLSFKWFIEYLMRNDAGNTNELRKVFGIIRTLTRLWEQNPDGECRFPPYPPIEAQW